jgi:proline racemase/trans-L-3-hydroxyproline dehydratase
VGGKRSIFVVDTHTCGEPTRVIVGGLPPIPGQTMAEKKTYLQENLDTVRTMLMHEPRGHQDMFGSVILPPADPQANFGLVFMDGGSYLNMCGHGSIGAVTVAIESGLVPMEEPMAKVVVDTPSGLVKATVEVRNEKALSVTVQNVPAFLYREDLELELPELGKKIKLDIAFGGSFFALVPAGQLELPLTPRYKQDLSRLGMALKKKVNAEIKMQHPLLPHINSVDLVEIYGPPADSSNADARNVVIFGDGQIDRSPCGTGTSAKMATLYAKNKLALHEDFIYESIIGTTFSGRLVGETTVNGLPAVIPEITGRAFITGYHHFIADPEDQLGDGFLI